MEKSKIPIRASTQDHLDIEDIRDDIIILKDGSCVLVITTTAINFGLLSEREQDATIYAYAALLNSLTFSIQILIRSKKKDISGYLKLLNQAETRESKKKIKDQITKYKSFIQEIVAKNEVLDKKFYLVIPMSSLEIGTGQAISSSIKRKKELPFSKEYILEKAKSNLIPKRDHLLKLLSRLGLRGRQLTTQELIQLFYEIYNPKTGTQPVGQKAEYQVPIVQAAKVVTPITTTPPPIASNLPAPSITSSNVPSPLPTNSPVGNQVNQKQTSVRNEINNLVKNSI
ncbi:hypothetical protein ACFL0Y_01650 [Patescibacteria group bacterium]